MSDRREGRGPVTPSDLFDLGLEAGVLHLRLRDPVPALGWPAQVANELAQALADWQFDERWRVLLLHFSGRAASGGPRDAGGGPGGDPCAADRTACADLLRQVGDIARPVLAAISGPACGFALELALACDLRLGTQGAHYAMDQLRAGCMPFAGGTQRLPRLVGAGRAFDMVLTGDPVDAAQALQWGLVQRLCEPHSLPEAAKALASRMAAAAPVALRHTKEAVLQGAEMPLDQALRLEQDLYLLLFETQDRREGLTAFRDRRAPRFEGR